MRSSKVSNNARKVARINNDRCDRSPLCPVKRSCPQGAITQGRRGFLNLFFDHPQIDESLCTGCGVCMSSCPHNAIYF